MPAHSQLLADFQALRTEDPTLRAIEAAARLGVMEGELLEARTPTVEVQRLKLHGPDFAPLMQGLAEVGPVMTLTRNAAAVHETTGPFGAVSVQGGMGQVTGDIDLRLFLNRWHAGYHVVEPTKSGTRSSFQIFDGHGVAVLKVYALEATERAKWQALVDQHTDPDEAGPSFAPPTDPAPDHPDSEIDVTDLRTRWQSLQHSHDFFMMLRDVGAGRLQALRLAGADLAARIPADRLEPLLAGAAARSIPIMCFVGNPGCIQIFSGPVQTIKPMGPWLNILDAAFNLHLRVDKVDSAWLVRKPTELRGQITSIELFDAAGILVCQFFGARPPGEGENPAWRDLAETLTVEETA